MVYAFLARSPLMSSVISIAKNARHLSSVKGVSSVIATHGTLIRIDQWKVFELLYCSVTV